MVNHSPAKAGSGNRLGSLSLSPPAFDDSIPATSEYMVRGWVCYHGVFSEMKIEIRVSACDLAEARAEAEDELDIAFRSWAWVGKPSIELMEE